MDCNGHRSPLGGTDTKACVIESCENADRTSEKEADATQTPTNNTQKRKKIHMTEPQCFSYSRSEEGKSALSDPKDMSKTASRNIDYRLLPVDRPRKRKRTCSIENASLQAGTEKSLQPSCVQAMLGPEGFTTASDMYNIVKKQAVVHSPSTVSSAASTIRSETKPKVNKKSSLINQTSIMDFMKARSSQEKAENGDIISESFINADHKEIDRRPKRTVMYSPIKKVGGAIYISDSPSSSPSSSQGSVQSAQSSLQDNAVVKQLFAAQKHIDSLPKNKKPSQMRSATKSKYLDKRQILSKSESVIVNDQENDSFDMNLAFDSDHDVDDMCDSTCTSISRMNNSSDKDKYGLLGSGSFPSELDKTGVNFFEMLPPEVLENIFCQLPMLDLCLNSNRVCSAWNDIIANEKVSSSEIVLYTCTLMQLIHAFLGTFLSCKL